MYFMHNALVEITEKRLLTMEDTLEITRKCKLCSLYYMYLYATICMCM